MDKELLVAGMRNESWKWRKTVSAVGVMNVLSEGEIIEQFGQGIFMKSVLSIKPNHFCVFLGR